MDRERVRAGLGGDSVGEAGEDVRIRVVAADEVDEPEHLLQDGLIDPARGPHAVRDVPAQPVRVHRRGEALVPPTWLAALRRRSTDPPPR